MVSTSQSLLRETTSAEADNLKSLQRNRTLTATLQDLSTNFHDQQHKAVGASGLSAQLEQAREETAVAKKRHRIMKSVLAAVIAGSGVDWARNDSLRDLILDEEDDND